MYRAFKRLCDLGLAVVTLLLLSPVFLLTAVLVRAKLGSPVLFRQERGGQEGRHFQIYKFRSMTDERDATGTLLPDEDRLTSFGSFLRRSSLDELPCLLNIITGQMSFVGPRPLVAVYLDRYTREQRRRHDVPPGLTGLTAVSGRNSLTWDEKFDLDVYYVDHQSFWLDLKILLLTPVVALTGRGTSADDHVTMPPFLGLDVAEETTIHLPEEEAAEG